MILVLEMCTVSMIRICSAIKLCRVLRVKVFYAALTPVEQNWANRIDKKFDASKQFAFMLNVIVSHS
jgi:hypothetical protein